jgi:hypothetical protein
MFPLRDVFGMEFHSYRFFSLFLEKFSDIIHSRCNRGETDVETAEPTGSRETR